MADARRAVRELIDSLSLAESSKLLIACSGGPDSMALAAATAFEAPRAGLKVAAAVIDHDLQEGSGQVALDTQARLNALGIDEVHIRKVKVAKTKEGLEAAARAARYAALDQLREASGAAITLLGHNLDDQAETVLLGLARGSGLRSISGMPSVDMSRKLARPLIGLSKASLRQACEDQGIEFWDDPHNQDSKFARVRVRQLAEQLEQSLGPGFASALARSADAAFEAEELISSLAAELLERAAAGASARALKFSISALADSHRAVLNRALLSAGQRAGGKDLSRGQVLEMAALITNWHGQKMLTFAGITVERVADELVITATKKTPGAC